MFALWLYYQPHYAMSKTKQPVKDSSGETKGTKSFKARMHSAAATFANIRSGLGRNITLLLYLMPDGEAKSGRTGSVVYQRNGRRRNFVVPALVQNNFTTPIRAAFSSFSSAFKDLTQNQIKSWNSQGGFFKSDRFARSIEVKGKALFVMLNQNLFNIGGAPISNPPLAGSVPGCVTLSLGTPDISATTLDIAYTPDPTDTSVDHLVEATGNLSPGISKPRNSDFRVIRVISGGAASPAASYAFWIAKFGTPIDGAKIFVRLTPINNVTGQAGGRIVASALWQA